MIHDFFQYDLGCANARPPLPAAASRSRATAGLGHPPLPSPAPTFQVPAPAEPSGIPAGDPVEGPSASCGAGDFTLDLYLRDISLANRSDPPGGQRLEPARELDEPARQSLVVKHLRFVVSMAFDYRRFGLPVADLINEGNLGLMRAAQRFDPFRGVRFVHYAQPWVRVHMTRALSYQAWPVSFPADFAWRHGRVCRAEEQLRTRFNRAPCDTEVARECGFELSTVRRLRSTPTPSFVPFDEPTPAEEDGLTLSETLPDENAPIPDREASRRSDRQYLLSLLEVLSPAQKKVIHLRYGLNDGRPRTLQEVARTMGYVRQGIHRLESTALARLRKHARFLLRTAAREKLAA